jgi:hypothetical protein
MTMLEFIKVSIRSNFKGKRYQRKVYFQISKCPYATLNDLWGQTSSHQNFQLYNCIINFYKVGF